MHKDSCACCVFIIQERDKHSKWVKQTGRDIDKQTHTETDTESETGSQTQLETDRNRQTGR